MACQSDADCGEKYMCLKTEVGGQCVDKNRRCVSPEFDSLAFKIVN
jgi:hypothetical protein